MFINTFLKSIGTMICMFTLIHYAAFCQPAVTLNNLPERSYTPTSKDTAQINALIRLAKDEYSNQMDTALQILNRAKQLSLEKSFPEGVAGSLLIQANFYLTRATVDKYTYTRIVDLIDEAEFYCRNALYDKDKVASLWYFIKAQLFTVDARYDSALSYLRNAEKIALARKDTLLAGTIYLRIAEIWILNNGDATTAIAYVKKAENLFSNNKRLKEHIENDILIVYMKVFSHYKNNTGLLVYAHKAIEAGKAKNDNSLLTAGYCVLVNYYIQNNNHDMAMQYARAALKVCDTKDYHFLYTSQWGMSLGYYKNKQYTQAKVYGLKALESLEKITIGISIAKAYLYRHLAKVYYKSGETTQAYLYHLKYSEISDSVKNIERQKAVEKLEAQYRSAEKDKALSEQKNKIFKMNFWILGITSVSVIIIGSLVGIFLYRNKKLKITQELERYKAIVEGEEKERNRLAKDLHDGVNSQLTAIKLQVTGLKERIEHNNLKYVENLEDLLHQTSGNVRRVAHNLAPDDLIRNGLAASIEEFCKSLFYDNPVEHEVHIYGDVDQIEPTLALSVYRIIQELATNVVKHAGATKVIVQVFKTDQELELLIEDDGRGINYELKKEGMGLSNVQERVTAHKGRIEIATNDNGTGTVINIFFPLVK